MSLFVIGDLHLSLSTDKSMDIFGGWDDYVNRLRNNWKEKVIDSDTVVIPGDISWAMSIEEAYDDFKFINDLPGNKIILKGNHDYWWTTKSKADKFFNVNNFNTLNVLHNNHYEYDGIGICGTRGWINDGSEPADAKVIAREAMRLDRSIQSAVDKGLKPIVFLHYPPIYGPDTNYDILDVLLKHNIKNVYYGHLHSYATKNALNGRCYGIDFRLISSDYLQFSPLDITQIVQNNKI